MPALLGCADSVSLDQFLDFIEVCITASAGSIVMAILNNPSVKWPRSAPPIRSSNRRIKATDPVP